MLHNRIKLIGTHGGVKSASFPQLSAVFYQRARTLLQAKHSVPWADFLGENSAVRVHKTPQISSRKSDLPRSKSQEQNLQLHGQLAVD